MQSSAAFVVIGGLLAIACVAAWPFARQITDANRRARSSVFSFVDAEPRPEDVRWTRVVLLGGVVIGVGAALIGFFRL